VTLSARWSPSTGRSWIGLTPTSREATRTTPVPSQRCPPLISNNSDQWWWRNRPCVCGQCCWIAQRVSFPFFPSACSMCILPKPRVTVRLVLGRRDYLNIMMVETPEIKKRAAVYFLCWMCSF
jgi:hypothetical protein